VESLGVAAISLLCWAALARALGRLEPALDDLGREQALFLDRLPERRLGAAIVASAASSLFLELAVIRWHSSVWELFAFYKNLSLLSCFIGLGLGYALAERDRIPVVLAAPVLAFEMALLVALRHGLPRPSLQSLLATPFQEQIDMGLVMARQWPHYAAVYSLLAVVFLLTALAFLPLGQLCGRLMTRSPPLPAYRMNLLGSLAGVALMIGASWLWTPPPVWFGVCFAALLAFQGPHPRALLCTGLASLFAMLVLCWPVRTGWERIYSPYQLLERGETPRGHMRLLAAGHYYQRVHDLSPAGQAADPEAAALANYYGLPYRLQPQLERVAVVGAGAGNDVAAALRAGARAVDAIEIDPVIERLGEIYHPEHPYSDPRVRRISDDARAFLRSSRDSYDLIVYGLLDSHALLNHVSSVRLDSFVYTIEGLRDARARLEDDGIVSLAFSVPSQEIGRKIYLMMQEAFDGHPPLCVAARYDGAVVFFQAKNGNLRVPAQAFLGTGFENLTAFFANPSLRADVSTDDWPYFYMPQRVYPVSYLFMVAMVLLLSVGLLASFTRERPGLRHGTFFFLGAGFMLIEAKGITEMGLVFGNTWQVTGVMIAGVLVMACLANEVVARLGVRRPLVAYLLLLASIAAGLAVARSGGLPATPSGKLATLVVLSSPLFFSGIAFSASLNAGGGIAAAMAANLLGAMCGGLLEYNSMYFGFQFLYWLGVFVYLAALACSLPRRS
jgi:hypothetical protein